MTITSLQYHDADAKRHLAQLGVTESDIHHALMAGVSDRSSRGPHDPTIAGPIVEWASTIADLRSNLVQRGWIVADHKGLPLVVDHAGAVGITVASGNAFTGRSGPVSTKHPKGPAMADLIEARQLSLFGPGQVLPPPARRTYVLLRHRSGGMVHSELSLPRSYRPHGNSRIEIVEWEHRIILEPLVLDIGGTRATEPGPATSVEVSVSPIDTAHG